MAVALVSCKQGSENTTASTSPEGTPSETAMTDIKVAYVVTDSLIAKYEFFKEKSEEITEKGRKFETDLSSRARGFEQEVANFEQTAGSMTQNQARAKQEDLMKKERNLMTFRDNLMQELSADESKLYSDVYDQIQEYLTSYAEENGFEMILSYTRGGAIWYSNKALDITDEILEGLNKKYIGSKTPTK
ncbi:OmpH family outer membrane protein [Mongoliitalea daihaiensis]|nr:OmpH family outer membrane protein [Mongoliitalea daihaiensis]